VAAHQDDMLNLAFRITGDADRSWDIASEVFLRLVEHPASVAGREDAIEEPLLHGVWTLSRAVDPRHDELPRDDEAVAAVALAAMRLPERSRAALALSDRLAYPPALIGAVLGITPAAAGELVTRARLDLAEGLGVRGRDPALVENEAARLYGLWPAEQGEAMGPEIVAEADRRGLIDAAGVGGAPVIAGVRITPAVGIALLLVPLLIAAAIAVAVRSGGDGGTDPASPDPVAGFTEAGTDGSGFTTPATTGRATTAVTPTVSPGDTPTSPDGSDGSGGAPGSGGSDGGASGGSAGTQPASPAPTTTVAAPEPPPVTRSPGSGAPPAPGTTRTTAPAPPPATTGGSQPPAPADPSDVPLP
jgi:DNA-directed RNA polymerase specialized sigma24 family protein